MRENNDIGSDSYITNNTRFNFDKQNSILFNTRRNRKTDLTEYYNLIYEYRNDCLVAAIEYNKDYYQDRDLKPSEEIFFKITITPFASINSPVALNLIYEFRRLWFELSRVLVFILLFFK